MCSLLMDIIGTIIGGLFLTLILFLLNEYVFPKINLTGEWIATIKIATTSYRKYQNLTIEYKVYLLQQGNTLFGSGEKVKDINSTGKTIVFERAKRVNTDIEGYLEKKYFKQSKVYFKIKEDGRIRKTNATYFLTVIDDNTLQGNFIWSAGDAIGTVTMKRS